MRGFAWGQKLFLVSGESMRPTLQPGEVVHGRPALAALLKRGDIVVFVEGTGRSVLHRIVSTRPLRTRGDNRLAPDPPVPPCSPLWRITHRRCRGRLVRLRIGMAGLRLARRRHRRLRLLAHAPFLRQDTLA